MLWLNDDAFLDAPVARLGNLFSWFSLQRREGFSDVNLPLPCSYVLGPDNSGTLRLAHPDEWSETHNLVIATPYDLFLDAGGTLPPFRDSEETALYAAVLSTV